MESQLINLRICVLALFLSGFIFEFANGLNCHVCSSDKFKDCATLHSFNLPTELCPPEFTSCFTKIEGGKTIRGCTALDDCDHKECARCKSNNCNAQIFPEDRLSCLHCAGTSCVNQTNKIDVRHPCTNYDPQDQCYTVFAYDGSVAYRGCLSDHDSVGRDFCVENPEQCSTCSGRACNAHKLKFEEKISCVKCTPDENGNCNVIDEGVEATECALTAAGYKNECFHYKKGDVSYRGCLFESADEIFNECIKSGSEKCSTCNEPNCNREPVTNPNLRLNPLQLEQEEKRDTQQPADNNRNIWTPGFKNRFCLECDSRVDRNCVENSKDTLIRLCDVQADGTNLGCFHKIEGNVVTRGCMINLTKSEQQECSANTSTCKTCLGEKCNRRNDFPECYTTDLSQTNVFKVPTGSKICTKYEDICFAQLQENKQIIRGCIHEHTAENNLPVDFLLTSAADERTYKLCSTRLCNVFTPINCHVCNSEDDKNCDAPMEDSIQECPADLMSSTCYHFDDGEYIERGCIANAGAKREECESDSKNCKKCFGEKCNNKIKFLECVSSDTSGKQKSTSKQCQKYDDECIIHVSKNVVRRGCLTDFTTSPVEGVNIVSDCRHSEVCEKCSESNCNNRKLKPESCLVCSSKDDPDCKRNPIKGMTKQCPAALRSMGCYHEQKWNLVTRGCVSNFNTEQREVCSDTYSPCIMCMGDSCNIRDTFPQCINCNSKTSDKCASKPNHAHYKVCNDYMDECYTHVKDGLLSRSCTGDSIIPKPEDCLSNSNHCELCSGDTCNEVIFESESCYECDSSINPSCNSSDLFTYTVSCPITTAEGEGCYHYIDKNTTQHIRGCVSSLTEDQREKYNNVPSEFKTCKGANCNSKSQLSKCMICDSDIHENCANNLDNEFYQTCKDYDSVCFTKIGSSITRGCVSSDDAKFIDKCTARSDKCEMCSSDGSACNNKEFEVEKCMTCDSKKDAYCESDPKQDLEKLSICTDMKASPKMGCYLSIKDDHVQRGCIQDLMKTDAARADNCLADSDSCKSCNESECNLKPTFQDCHTCISSDDVNCLLKPTLTESRTCKAYLASCITAIVQDRSVQRGCHSDNESTIKLLAYKHDICEDNNCNDEVYPKGRLQCFHCSGEEECNFVNADMTELKNSLKYRPCNAIDDECYTYINKGKQMFRGCLSDGNGARELCDSKYENGRCVKCSGDGCNNLALHRKADYTCAKCRDTQECQFQQNASMVEICQKDVSFGDVETCYTYHIQGADVDRGCTLDVDSDSSDWCKKENGCETCTERSCNDKNVRFSSCFRCQSNTKGDCASVTNSSSHIKQCDDKMYPYNQRGCYMSNKDGNVARGCIVDLNQQEYENCNRDDSCTLCLDDNCNDKEASTAMRTSFNILMMTSIIFVTFFTQNSN